MNNGELEGVHIFDSMHGQEAMNIIFGRSPLCSKLYSARNGLLIHYRIAEAFDMGKFVIVPDMRKRPRVDGAICSGCERRQEYMMRILDPTWCQLDEDIHFNIKIT